MAYAIPVPAERIQRMNRLSTKPKTIIRMYSFPGKDGKPALAEEMQYHWVLKKRAPCTGNACPHCKQAAETKDKTLRVKTAYKMALCDIKDHPDKAIPYEVSSSVWKAIYAILSEAGEDGIDSIIGDEGKDIVITFNRNADPAYMYTVMPSMKPSAKLSAVVDMDATVETNGTKEKEAAPADANGKDAADDETEAQVGNCSVKTANGDSIRATWSGKKNKNKQYIVEIEGRLQLVDPANITIDKNE